jgi:hypothetical protein
MACAFYHLLITNLDDRPRPNMPSHKINFPVPILILAIMLPGCIPVSFAPTQPPATATEAATPSPTIVWFPPTATWTPAPVFLPSPTIDPLPGAGAIILTDDFSDPSLWTLANTAANTIIVDRNRLTLAANSAPMALFTLRTNTLLTNFYAEVNVSVNRCEGNDSYGLLFRSAGQYYGYRIALACNGQLRLDRLRGETIPLQNWLPSGDAPPGAPSEVRIGVWVSGVEMRVLLNGHYQFSVIDPLFANGTLGFFVDAKSAAGMNISFSDLIVREVFYLSPTPTMTPSNTPKPTRTKSP